MFIQRLLKQQIEMKLIPGRVVVIYGARRVGKTTLVADFLQDYPGTKLLLNGDSSRDRELLETFDHLKLKDNFGNCDLLVVDEAQNVSEIGARLKLIVDTLPALRVIVSGSASFDLANQVGEPLTGRKRTLTLFPLSFAELYAHTKSERQDSLDVKLEEFLIFGSYPLVYQAATESDKIDELFEVVDSYLYRDLLELAEVKNSRSIRNLLELLALQLGQEVSLNELATKLSLHVVTVARYLDLLEKSFVIFRLGAFSRNLRNEINRNAKYYFWDNGVRNALIKNFNKLNLRTDVGALWENFLMVERCKHLSYQGEIVNRYFWRTYEQKELDLIEDCGGHLSAFEFKWGQGKSKSIKDFEKAYPGSSYAVISPENFHNFILG